MFIRHQLNLSVVPVLMAANDTARCSLKQPQKVPSFFKFHVAKSMDSIALSSNCWLDRATEFQDESRLLFRQCPFKMNPCEWLMRQYQAWLYTCTVFTYWYVLKNEFLHLISMCPRRNISPSWIGYCCQMQHLIPNNQLTTFMHLTQKRLTYSRCNYHIRSQITDCTFSKELAVLVPQVTHFATIIQ